MIVKALMPGRVRCLALRAAPKELQRGEHPRCGRFPCYPPTLYGDRITGQGEANDCDTARRCRARCIGYQAVECVAVLGEIVESTMLQAIDESFVGVGNGAACRCRE